MTNEKVYELYQDIQKKWNHIILVNEDIADKEAEITELKQELDKAHYDHEEAWKVYLAECKVYDKAMELKYQQEREEKGEYDKQKKT